MTLRSTGRGRDVRLWPPRGFRACVETQEADTGARLRGCVMRNRASRMGLVAAAAMLVVACSGGSGGSGGPGGPGGPTAPGAWPADLAADLAPTGWMLWGGAGADDVVVDGAGQVWVDGPWQVARIDPASGAGTVWDAADDAAFASVEDLAPAQPAGVWMRSGRTARLFDGERFVAVLELPAEPADPGADQPASPVMLQVGDELWVGGPSGVNRWADGQWSAVGQGQVVDVGPLAFDSDGAVWAGGTVLAANGTRTTAPVRWDPVAGAWTTPAPSSSTPSGLIGDLAADPSGGVWVISSGEGTAQHGVFRFDGTTWTRVGPGGYAGDLSVTPSGQVWAMASAGGGLYGSGSAEASRLAGDGTWQAYRDEEGAPVADELQWVHLAVAGETVVLSRDGGLDSSLGEAGAERFVSLWEDPSAVVKAPAAGSGSLLATGADEVYLPAEPLQHDPNDLSIALMRRRDFEWVRIDGSVTGGDLPTGPMLATDGAVWVMTRDGLLRDPGDSWEILDTGIDPWSGSALVAGPAGSAWLVDDGDVVRVDPDGTRTSIGRPEGAKPLWSMSPLAASGEVLWVAQPNGPVHQWDGGWTTLPSLGERSGVLTMAAATDGSLWALVSGGQDDQTGMVRYADGKWARGPADGYGLAPAADASMCTIRTVEDDVACYDAAMTVVRTYPVGAAMRALSVAPDGALWVLGEQVARISPPTG